MQTTKIRLAAVSAATLALAIAGTAAVAAHPGDREDFWGDEMGPGRMGGFGRGDMESFGLDSGARGPMGGMFAETMDGFVRHETIYQTEDGTVSHRTDAGTVASTGEASLEYTLPTGETASLTTDDATEIVSLSVESFELGNSGRTRERLVPETVALADLAVGTEVLVWSQSQADGSFLAQRIVVRPAAEVTADDAAVDASGEDDAASGITEVPASAAPADA
jgi:hypothetical protein